MRSLKYAMLGLIDRAPISGYDIMKEFNKELGNFWTAKHSQIYPELKKLADEGLIELKVEISGEVMEKKVYSITKSGREDFLSWLNREEDIDPTPKEVFRLRMYFANHLEATHLEEMLNSQLMQREEKLIRLQKAMEEYESVPEINQVIFGDYILIESAILREEATIKWLKKCMGYIKK